MRLSLKHVGLMLVAVLAMSAVASASASAHEYLVGGKAIAAGEHVTAEGTGKATLTLSLAGVKAPVECATDVVGGSLEAAGRSHMTFSLKSCQFTQKHAAGCRIGEPFVIDPQGTITGGRLGTEFWGAGERKGELTNITIKDAVGAGECPLMSSSVSSETWNVGGNWWCATDATNTLAETEAAEHEAICATANNSLYWHVNEVFNLESTTKIKLASGKHWSVR